MTKRIQDYLSYPTGSFQHAQVYVASLYCAVMARGPNTSELDSWARVIHANPLAMTKIGIGGAGAAPGTDEAATKELEKVVKALLNTVPSGEMAYINSTDPLVRERAGGNLIARVNGTSGELFADLGSFSPQSFVVKNITHFTSVAIISGLNGGNQQHVNHVSFALLKHEAGSNSTIAQQSTITTDDSSLANAIANYL